jgi:hypothetical protein
MSDNHKWAKGRVGYWCERCGYQKSKLVVLPNHKLDHVDCALLAKARSTHDWEFHEKYPSKHGPNFPYTNCWVCRRCHLMSRWSLGPPFAEMSCGEVLMNEALT